MPRGRPSRAEGKGPAGRAGAGGPGRSAEPKILSERRLARPRVAGAGAEGRRGAGIRIGAGRIAGVFERATGTRSLAAAGAGRQRFTLGALKHGTKKQNPRFATADARPVGIRPRFVSGVRALLAPDDRLGAAAPRTAI